MLSNSFTVYEAVVFVALILKFKFYYRFLFLDKQFYLQILFWEVFMYIVR